MSDLTDLGQKHATGMGHSAKEHEKDEKPKKKKVGFGGTFLDLGSKDAVGVNDAK